MARQRSQDSPKVLVITEGGREVGCVISEEADESSGACKYFRITAAGWRVLEQWSETPQRSYKAKVQ